ncbi:MAG: RNB domain-containing ribonuclease [Opitutaceae bacterium]|jgi:ribonuclease R|nr:RNB domain-containing ribonuclease [Opitutaceae bacterium]
MKLRDRILAHLRSPGYAPADLAGLARALGLNKKDRRSLAHEIRLGLSQGALVYVKGDRIALAGDDALAIGRLMFRAGGSACLIPDPVPGAAEDEPAVHIAPEDTGVALHGDRVAVQILAHALRRPRNGRAPEPTGRVVRIEERANETIVGNLRRVRNKYYVNADNPRFFHEIAVADPAASDLNPIPAPGDKVVVRLAEWTARHKNLEGLIIERLGKTFEPRAELAGLCHKYKLDPAFPAEVERELAALPDTPQPPELSGRLDYREVPTLTIDPDDAKDFDDALSIEPLDHGDTRVGVHIADVGNYVRPGTALDREARRRGNSTYLVGAVIPMLPQKLSNGLCSLVEAQDRLCKTVFLVFDKKIRLKHTSCANTIIRSRKRLTYRQARALLFENRLEKIRALPLPPRHQTGATGRALAELGDLELVDLQSWLRKLWAIASKLRHARMAAGSLDLDMPETKVFVDEQGRADRLELIEHDESHQLIEEFMLAANETVARLTRAHRLPSLYRVHDEPDEDKLHELRQTLAASGITTGDLSRHDEMAKLLATLSTHPQGHLLRTHILRSLKKACYRGTPDGHYGLAKKDYTHFTSPIRRYADLVVHRVLEYHLVKHAGHPAPAAGRHPAPTPGRMETLGEHLSLTETNSQEAERESVKIKQLEFFERELAKKTKTRFEAVITDIRQHGLFVELVQTLTYGFVPMNTLTDDDYHPNNAGTLLTGRKTRRRLPLGSHLAVVVHKVDRFKRLIDFRPAPAK